MSINISPETKLGKVKNYTAELHMKGKMDSYSIIDNEGNESKPMPKDRFMEFIQQQKLSVDQMEFCIELIRWVSYLRF